MRCALCAVQNDNSKERFVDLVAELLIRMQPQAFPPREIVVHQGEYAENLYIIRSGLIGLSGVLLRKDQIIGMDIIIGNKREYMAACLTHCNTLMLSRTTLLEVLYSGKFEDIKLTVYARARWLRMRNNIIKMAKAIRAIKMMHGEFKWASATPDSGTGPLVFVTTSR